MNGFGDFTYTQTQTSRQTSTHKHTDRAINYKTPGETTYLMRHSEIATKANSTTADFIFSH